MTETRDHPRKNVSVFTGQMARDLNEGKISLNAFYFICQESKDNDRRMRQAQRLLSEANPKQKA